MSPLDSAPTYLTLLISLAHPEGGTINRYAVGFDSTDPLFCRIDLNHWAEPEMRSRLLSLLCDDWLSDGCCVVGCELIAGSVQWQRVEA